MISYWRVETNKRLFIIYYLLFSHVRNGKNNLFLKSMAQILMIILYICIYVYLTVHIPVKNRMFCMTMRLASYTVERETCNLINLHH